MKTASSFRNDSPVRRLWPDPAYGEAYLGGEAYPGGSLPGVSDGHAGIDAWTMFFCLACGTRKPAASTKLQGEAYPRAVNDAPGHIFDGGKTYRMHLHANMPAKLCWSATAYDTATRSQIENGAPFSRISTLTNPERNSDGSTDLFFGPEAPAGREKNWVKTMRGKSWFLLFRLYGPSEGQCDGTWGPDDLVEVRDQ